MVAKIYAKRAFGKFRASAGWLELSDEEGGYMQFSPMFPMLGGSIVVSRNDVMSITDATSPKNQYYRRRGGGRIRVQCSDAVLDFIVTDIEENIGKLSMWREGI